VNEKGGVSTRLTPLTVAAALKTLAVTISRHSERHADAIEVVSTALRELHQELKQERGRSHALQARLTQAEERLAELERTVAALRRQGWIQ
jgi:DNA anti-recombination protein RmuC